MAAKQKYYFYQPLKNGLRQEAAQKLMKPLYGFNGKRIESIWVITLPVSFGTTKNPRIEYITFDAVDMLYPYNAILTGAYWTSSKLPCIQHSSALKSQVPLA
jgi:hypothetical protein